MAEVMPFFPLVLISVVAGTGFWLAWKSRREAGSGAEEAEGGLRGWLAWLWVNLVAGCVLAALVVLELGAELPMAHPGIVRLSLALGTVQTLTAGLFLACAVLLWRHSALFVAVFVALALWLPFRPFAEVLAMVVAFDPLLGGPASFRAGVEVAFSDERLTAWAGSVAWALIGLLYVFGSSRVARTCLR